MYNIKQESIVKIDYLKYWELGINYSSYKLNVIIDLETNQDPQKIEFIKLNQSRMKRVDKTFQITDRLSKVIHTLKKKKLWLMISENWCGDASQNLPVFNKIAELSEGMIELRIVYRDRNPTLMDAHLTNKTRSIPKLIQLDENFNVTGIWGSRPMEAQELTKVLKENPLTADTYATELHAWYARNKSMALQEEILQLLSY